MPEKITTTAGEVFTSLESVDMARLVYKRFGNNEVAATGAWNRMLQNDCSVSEFMEIVEYPEHTHNCQGDCQTRMNDYSH